MKILLVEPSFPYPSKSKNQANGVHKNFVPVGLLKLGAYYKSKKDKVKLVRGLKSKKELNYFKPQKILVTSIFTYWSEYVWQAISHYRTLFPKAKIVLGGIYATLHYDKKEFQKNLKKYKAQCHIGLHKKAEKYYPDYSLLGGDVDHHVTHAMRGCIRKCKFCGVWKIEPQRSDKPISELIDEIKTIGKNKVVFFDNNFLAHKNVELLLKKLPNLKVDGKPVTFESQSGFDGRLLEETPALATLLKQARFQNVRIAWDNSLSDCESIEKQIKLLENAGYRPKNISVFMIYNFNTTYDTMLKKLKYCAKWGVQITDCRYRPLSSTYDHYNPQLYRQGQTGDDYYIHTKAGWTDERIRDFRKKVRQHNIWVRYAKDKGLAYDKRMEKWSLVHNTFKYFHMGRPPQLNILEKSPTWERRLGMMNRVKSYYKKNNLNSLNFSNFAKKEIDEELNQIMEKIVPKNQDCK